MRSNFLMRIASCLAIPIFSLACSGNPEVIEWRDGDASEGGGNGNPHGAGEEPGIVDLGGDSGAAGDDGVGPNCKKACQSAECGPVADGCGAFIECGACTAPETCGGGGEPSRCGGTAACTPATCDEVGADCGLHPDGCGGVLECWSDAAKAVGDEPACEEQGRLCIEGHCSEPFTSCEPETCADHDAMDGSCGPISDGCGGTLDCGFTCQQDEICGVEELSRCGKPSCQPLTCETAIAGKPDGYCGFVPDGCGGEIPGCAATCTAPETCGGGGTLDVCGIGQTTCEPKTAADCGNTCGPISDGCGGVIDCGGCTAPETCGGGEQSGQCGAPVCQPKTCPDFGAECGQVPDGCGETLECGSCSGTAVCNANQCEQVTCTPKTQAQACSGGRCGPQSDGCGGTVDCSGCSAPNTCGGGGTPSVCGSPPCTPLTCQQANANCGPIGDGCGGIIPSCGECTVTGEICGGGGIASVCGAVVGGGGECTGLCTNVVRSCPSGQETRLTGTVFAPNGTQPLYNALIYVPNAPLPAITTGPSCERCEDEDLGEPLAAALTGADGKFVLRNVPAGVEFPLVVKMGKWRRVVTMPAITQCTNRNLAVDEARLPRNMNDAEIANRPYVNIPKMAMVTGDVDELECVIRKIGVSDSEFTLPSGTGRVQLYRANGAHGACTNWRSDGSCRSENRRNEPLGNLFANNRIDAYDVAIFGCEGSPNEHNDAYDAAMRDWANRGGRVFASHYSYVYLHDNGNFANTATWGGPWADNGSVTTGIIDTSFPKGQAFNAWLGHVDAHHQTYGNGYIEINDPRDYVRRVATTSERFVYTDDSRVVQGNSINEQDAVQQYSFNTPVGASAANICGRVLYSAFHVANANDNNDEVFPSHCSTQPLTPQEKVLMFMLFDLSACVSTGNPPNPPSCTPKTCQGLGATCGYVADGCGGILACGTCTAPSTCGGGGVANQCGDSCRQTTCGAQGANCGIIADGCGSVLNCGECVAPAACGGGGTANVCGVPSCEPRSCADVGAQCGPVSDGCGGTVNCGTCPSGTACGGGGTPNVCGSGSCNPKTCQGENAQCGFIGDGCGGTVACGTCPDGQTCGGSGPNLCGGACAPRTCESVTAECGFVGDGCGGLLNCGTCSAPEVCGGGGVPSQCGGGCTPRSCTDADAECGATSDGCGGVLQCGICPPGQSCGGNGIPNQCGTGTCEPRSCAEAAAECGIVGNGCGGVLNCGECVAPESCGGNGVPNQCGPGGCVPLSCEDQNSDCGPAADGCGNLLDCGTCVAPQSCGGGGVPSRCGSVR